MPVGLVMGIDVGASGAKAALFDPRGRVRGRGYAPCPPRRVAPTRVEQDPTAWWQATVEAVRSALAVAGPGAGVDAIGVSSTNALVLLDRAGRPVRPAIMQLDARAASEAASLRESLGAFIATTTGNHVAENGYWLPLLRWLRANEATSLAHTAAAVYPSGYIVRELTGALVIDVTRAATTLLFDFAAATWSATLLRQAGLRRRQLPEVVEATTVVGHLRHEAATALGLPAGIPVVAGAMDSVAAALGLGLAAAGDAALMLGTVARAGILSRHIGPLPDVIGCPFPDTGLRWLQAAFWDAGAWLQWIVDVFFSGDWEAVALTEAAGHLADLAFVLPGPQGAGAIRGITIDHSRADIGAAGVIGVLVQLTDGLGRLSRAADEPVGRVAVCGRPARLVAPCLAGLAGHAIDVPADSDAETRGAALLAARGATLFRNLADAVAAMVPEHEHHAAAADGPPCRAASRDTETRLVQTKPPHADEERDTEWVH